MYWTGWRGAIAALGDRPPWKVDPFRFARDPRLDPTARHILTLFGIRADHAGRIRGGKWIGEETGYSRNTISRAIGRLEEAGRIRVERRQTNVYTITRDTLDNQNGSKPTTSLPPSFTP